MRRFFLLLSITFFIFSVSGCKRGPSIDPATLFTAYQGDNKPGAAVLVIREGEVVYQGLFGMADLKSGTPINASTNFRLASVTKQFTAMAIMMMIDHELLSLDTKLSEVYPQFPDYADQITIQHLLQHTSGLMDYESLMSDTTTVQVHDRDVLQLLMATDATAFPPGTQYSYSNSGYAVLAMIVEEMTGVPFPEFLYKNIFTPVGMNSSVAFVDGVSTVSNRAFGYAVTPDSMVFEFADQSTTSAVLGDGGIYSSLDDLMKWDQALYTDTLVTFETLQKAFTPGLESYGFGWRIEDHNGHLRYSHTGGTSGFRNIIQRYPDDELTIIILTNRNEPSVEELATRLADLYL